MKIYETHSEIETKKLAQKIARKFKKGVIALSGDLGAGKTTFVQGFAKGLGIKEKIISPTFVVIRQHKIPKSNRILYHVDLYRLENQEDLRDLGLQEIISNPKNIVIIEWAEKLVNLPKNTTKIRFYNLSGFQRKIIIHKS